EGEPFTWPDGSTTELSASDAGQQDFTLDSHHGCDSVVSLTLVVDAALSVTLYDSLCAGSEYALPDGEVATTGGVFTFASQSAAGCDSTVTLVLTETQPSAIGNGLPDGWYCVEDGVVTLDVSAYNGQGFQWNTGDTGPVLYAENQGSYVVTYT